MAPQKARSAADGHGIEVVIESKSHRRWTHASEGRTGTLESVDRIICANTSASPERLHEIVSDLTTYPSWLGLVSKVEPAPVSDDDAGPAHLVTLRANVGPLARSKRLRMVRTECTAPCSVRFARFETDGRNHSDWVMSSQVAPTDGGSEVRVRLIYEGQLWDRLIEGVLERAVDEAVPRLSRLAQTEPRAQ